MIARHRRLQQVHLRPTIRDTLRTVVLRLRRFRR